jgi:hypothetical protein
MNDLEAISRPRLNAALVVPQVIRLLPAVR